MRGYVEMGNGKLNKIIAMPGPPSDPTRIRPDQIGELRQKIQEAAIRYMEEMTTPGILRRDLIEKAANVVSLVINLASVGSDAVTVCTAARVIRDRMDLVRASVLPAVTAGVPDFAKQEQDLVDLLVGDTGVIIEIYSSVLDEDQMKALLQQLEDNRVNEI